MVPLPRRLTFIQMFTTTHCPTNNLLANMHITIFLPHLPSLLGNEKVTKGNNE